MSRKAVIVAAGLSSRLYPLTADIPKPLLRMGNETLLERSLRLLKACDVDDVGIVAGYRADAVRDLVGSAATIILNPFYRHCNNMGSLMMARHFVGDDTFVYLHGDLAYDERMLPDFLRASGVPDSSCLDLLTDFGETDEEAMKVRTDSRGRLLESNKSIPVSEAAGEWTGIAVVHDPPVVFDELERHLMTSGLGDYDTAAFTSLAASGCEVRCIPTNGQPWKEIDTAEDLEAARQTFAP